MFKRLRYVLCFSLIVVFLVSCGSTSDIPAATSDFYVNDFAGIISAKDKNTMQNKAVKYAEETGGIQIVVTTVKSLNGSSIDDFATDMYNLYGIGKDDKGALILLSTGDGEIKIEVGYGLNHILTATKCGELIDSVYDDLKERRISIALVELQDKTIAYITSKIKPEEMPIADTTAKKAPVSDNTVTKAPVSDTTITKDPASDSTITKAPDSDATTTKAPDSDATTTKAPSNEDQSKKTTTTGDSDSKKPVTQNTVQKESSAKKDKDDRDNILIIILISAFLFIGVIVFYVHKKKEFEKEKKSLQNQLNAEKGTSAELRNKNREQSTTISGLNSTIDDLNSANASLQSTIQQKDGQIEKLSEQKDSLNQRNEKQRSEIATLNGTVRQLNGQIGELSGLVRQNNEKMALIYKVHPSLDEDIDRYFAGRFDEQYRALTRRAAASEAINEFKACIDAFEALSEAQQAFVTIDMGLIREFYKTSLDIRDQEKATNFTKMVNETIGSAIAGSEKMLTKLHELKRTYDQLPASVQAYIASTLISTLTRFISEGEAERQRRLEAEERQRQQNEAREFTKLVNAKIGHITRGTERLLYELRLLMDEYNRLSRPVKDLIPNSLINRIKGLISEGEAEQEERERREEEERKERERQERERKERERQERERQERERKERERQERERQERERKEREEREEEERRRRARMAGSSIGSHHSYSGGSSHHSSSHHGLGGRSGGGGARRKF